MVTVVGVIVQDGSADEIDSRYKTNNYLDKINDSFFAPRGLIALITSWKPSKPHELITTSNFDMNPAISLAVTNSESRGIKKINHKFETSNGMSAFEWLETAPLIFPTLNDLVEFGADGSPNQVKKQNEIKRSSKFVEEYMDRRARAKWASNNPQSILANVTPKETFNSKFSDPNHPVGSGDPLALVTGRKKSESTPRDGGSSPSLAGPGNLGKAKNIALHILSGGLTLLQNDILYLIIVNRPTTQQLAKASNILRTVYK